METHVVDLVSVPLALTNFRMPLAPITTTVLLTGPGVAAIPRLPTLPHRVLGADGVHHEARDCRPRVHVAIIRIPEDVLKAWEKLAGEEKEEKHLRWEKVDLLLIRTGSN